MPAKKLVYITRPIAPPWDEGSKNLALSLASNIKHLNLKKYILTTRQKFPLDKKVERIPLFSGPDINPLNKLKLIFFLIKSNADIFHFIFVATPVTSFLIKTILIFKKTQSIQTIVALEGNPVLFGSEIVCFSKTTARKLGHNIKRVKVIPPAIDIHKFKPGIKKNKIAFLGELYRTKSYKIILKLTKSMARNFSNYEIVMGFRRISEPENEPKMVKKLKKDLGGFKNVKWEKTIENMPEFLKDTKLIIFPAKKTSGKFDFPLVLIEGLSCGIPSIVSPIGPLLELSEADGVVRPHMNTPASFLKTVKSVLEPRKYSKLSGNARKTAIKNFSINKIAKKYEKIYSQISS